MKFNEKIFKRLANNHQDNNTNVTIFIPTERTGDGQAARIRFKNQLSEVTDKLMDENLLENPMSKKEALTYLAKAYELLDNEDFWLYQSNGLAVFLNQDVFEYYTLPIEFKSFNYVDNVFYLRPLMPIVTGESRFFILALSQNEVRFFEGAAHSITPVKISDLVPESLEESMATIDVTYPAELQSHGGGNGPIFHGQGGEKDGKTDRIVDYFRMVDKGLMEMLYDEKAPLIIAAVDYLVPMYKEISKYSNIVEAHISGNVENDDPVLLHEKAWSIMKDIVRKDIDSSRDAFSGKMAEGKASLMMADIAANALMGKVETLFIDKNATEMWGTYLPEANSIDVHSTQNKNNACLLNFAAISTYLQGGTVYNVSREEMPHQAGKANAIYRY
ncbi:MAG: hypothetical protein AAF960_04785 [Bacteroidota bacterium]